MNNKDTAILVLKELLDRKMDKEKKIAFLQSYIKTYGQIPKEYEEYVEQKLSETK